MLCCKKIKITPLVLSSVLGLFACFEPPAEPLSIGDAAATRPMPPEGERVSLFDLLMAQTRGEDGKIKIPYPFTKLVEYLSQWGKPVQVLVPLGRSLQRHAGLPNPFADPRRLVAFASKPLSETGGKLQDLDLHGRLFIGYVEQSNSLEIMSLLPGRTEFDFQLIENYCSGGADCTPHIKNAVTGECMACHQAGQPIFSTFPWSESNADPIIADLLKHYDADKDGKVDGIPIEQRREDVEDFCHLLTVTTDPDRPDETMTSACYEDLVIYGRSLQLGQMLWDNTAKLCPDLSAPACRRQLLKVLVARSSLSEAINKLNLNDNDLISFAIKTTHFLTDRVLLEGKDLSAMSGKEIADKIIEEHKRDGHLLLQQNNAIFNPLVSRLGFNLNLFEAIGTIRTTLELVGRMLFAGQGRRSIITSQLLEDNKNLDEDIITWLTETTITAEVTTDDASSLRLILGRRAANDEDNIGDDGDNGDNSPFIVVAVAAPNDCDSFAEIRSGCTFGESGQFSLANKKATHLDFEIKAASSPAANVAIPPAAQEEGARLPAATQEYISTLTITFAGETETTKVSLHCSENDEGSSEQICSEDGTNCSIVSTQGIVCTIFDLNADDKAVDRMLESFSKTILTNQPYLPKRYSKYWALRWRWLQA